MLRKITRLLPHRFKKHYFNPLITFLRDRKTYNTPYDPSSFFNQFHRLSVAGDDGSTISPDHPKPDAKYHYNVVENGIISYLKDNDIDTTSILDIGSGSGHWIDFYSEVYNPTNIYGVDISEEAVKKLNKRFDGYSSVTIYQTDVLDSDICEKGSLNIINAIGVLFHIVSDEKWEATIKWCYEKLTPGGVLIAGGFFGLVTANVQFEPVEFSTVERYKNAPELAFNKRVRSKRYWKNILSNAGFSKMTFKKNKIPAHINTPENNLLFAVK